MADPELSNLTYKGWRSITLQLVIMGFFTGTALLLGGYIGEVTWKDAVLGMLAGYIVRDGVSKVAEAYLTKKIDLIKE